MKPDLIDRLRDRFRHQPVHEHLPFQIEDLAQDRCVLALEFLPHIDTGAGNIHGGVLATLADAAVACALATNFDGKMGFATSTLNIHFLRRARTKVKATATIIKKGSKVCVGHVDVRDADEQLVAVVVADFVLTTSRFEDSVP